MRNKSKIILGLALSILLASPTWAASEMGKKRAEVRNTCQQSLKTLYKAKPGMKKKIAAAPGYACFKSFGVTVIAGGAGGHGLVHDNKTKKDTFMNMAQASVGIDFGIKNYREVLVFHDRATMEEFINSGWKFAAQAGATGKVAGQGGDDVTTSAQGIDVYPMTRGGLAMGASIGERKYWKNEDLN